MCAELLKQMNIKTRMNPTVSTLMSSLVGFTWDRVHLRHGGPNLR